jgi:hypothetical protein
MGQLFSQNTSGQQRPIYFDANNICLDITVGSVTVPTLRWNFEKIEFPFMKFL